MTEPSRSHERLLNAVRVDQQQSWARGVRRDVESYFLEHPDLARDSSAAIELVYAEYVLREELGESPSAEEYLERFPDLASLLERQFALEDVLVSLIQEDSTLDVRDSPSVDPSADGASAKSLAELQVPADRFATQRLLGRGSTGVVLAAYDQKWNTSVAVKALHNINPASILRLKQEFRVLADLTHPNLVEYHELLSAQDNWFIVMELVDGVKFTDYARGNPSGRVGGDALAPSTGDDRYARLRNVLQQLIAGLDALHAAGRLHRDIKPSNVLVTASGRVVILDLGLASPFGEAFAERPDFAGTIPYMAPEQCELDILTPACDWYGVGAMLYETLVGQRPFAGSVDDILKAKQLTDPAPPSQQRPGIPADLDELCRCLLLRDPARRVAMSTSLLDTIRSQPAQAGMADDLLCHGRNTELERLQQIFVTAESGRTQVVYVRGEPGVGKSTLVQQFLGSLVGRASVFRGRCYENASIPFTALDQVVDEIAQHLRACDHPAQFLPLLARLSRTFPVLEIVAVSGQQLLPDATPDDPDTQWQQLSDAFVSLLRKLSERRAVVVFIDDIHWGDLDSARLLVNMIEALMRTPLMVVASFRNREAVDSRFVKHLQSEWDRAVHLPKVEELGLGPLSQQHSKELAERLLGLSNAPENRQIAMIVQAARGSPLFLRQLVEATAGQDSNALIVANDLEDFLWDRVNQLGETSRRLLVCLAVAGQPTRSADIYRAARLGTPEPLRLSQLTKRHFLRSRGVTAEQRIEMYHDRMRESILGRLSEDQLQQQHLQLAETLESSGAEDPEAIFGHYQASGHKAKAAQFAVVAADRAVKLLAFERASQLYRSALSLGTWQDADDFRLNRKLADALSNAGQGVTAAGYYRSLAARTTGAVSLDLGCLAAKQLLSAGRVADGTDALQATFTALGLKFPHKAYHAILGIVWNQLRLWLRGVQYQEHLEREIAPDDMLRVDASWAATILIHTDLMRGVYFALSYALSAFQLGEPKRLTRALAQIGVLPLISFKPNTARSERYFRLAEGLCRAHGDPLATGYLEMTRGFGWALLGKWQQALDMSIQAECRLREQCVGAHLEIAATLPASTAALFFLGDIRELSRRVRRMLVESRHCEDAFSAVLLATFFGNIMWLAQDQVDDARRHAREAMEHWPDGSFHQQHLFELIGSSHIDLYIGDATAAADRIANAWPKFRRNPLIRNPLFRIIMLHLRARATIAASALHADDRWLRLARRDARELERENQLWSDGLAKLIRAEIAADTSDHPHAAELLEDAIGQLEEAEMALFSAAAKMRLGHLLQGDRGAQLIAAGTQFMVDQEIQHPQRIAKMLVPGNW